MTAFLPSPTSLHPLAAPACRPRRRVPLPGPLPGCLAPRPGTGRRPPPPAPHLRDRRSHHPSAVASGDTGRSLPPSTSPGGIPPPLPELAGSGDGGGDGDGAHPPLPPAVAATPARATVPSSARAAALGPRLAAHVAAAGLPPRILPTDAVLRASGGGALAKAVERAGGWAAVAAALGWARPFPPPRRLVGKGGYAGERSAAASAHTATGEPSVDIATAVVPTSTAGGVGAPPPPRQRRRRTPPRARHGALTSPKHIAAEVAALAATPRGVAAGLTPGVLPGGSALVSAGRRDLAAAIWRAGGAADVATAAGLVTARDWRAAAEMAELVAAVGEAVGIPATGRPPPPLPAAADAAARDAADAAAVEWYLATAAAATAKRLPPLTQLAVSHPRLVALLRKHGGGAAVAARLGVAPPFVAAPGRALRMGPLGPPLAAAVLAAATAARQARGGALALPPRARLSAGVGGAVERLGGGEAVARRLGLMAPLGIEAQRELPPREDRQREGGERPQRGNHRYL